MTGSRHGYRIAFMLGKSNIKPGAHPIRHPEPAHLTDTLSSHMEMYLKTILQLQREDRPVGVTAVAKALGVSVPSASQALRALRERGLVVHPTYGKVRLSDRGRDVAAAVNERFETLHRFLTNVLHVDERTARQEACQIEHVLTDDTLWRLEAWLDFVSRCRLDLAQVLGHFHEYLEHRMAGNCCPTCEVPPLGRGEDVRVG